MQNTNLNLMLVLAVGTKIMPPAFLFSDHFRRHDWRVVEAAACQQKPEGLVEHLIQARKVCRHEEGVKYPLRGRPSSRRGQAGG
jgi:hypothetical protein